MGKLFAAHPLWELLTVHGGLEAVAKVNMQQLAAVAIQHQVAGMPVAQAQQITHLHAAQYFILSPSTRKNTITISDKISSTSSTFALLSNNAQQLYSVKSTGVSKNKKFDMKILV